LEQTEVDRGKAATSAKAHLVDPYQAAGRGTHTLALSNLAIGNHRGGADNFARSILRQDSPTAVIWRPALLLARRVRSVAARKVRAFAPGFCSKDRHENQWH
jgi:hypothetical protein